MYTFFFDKTFKMNIRGKCTSGGWRCVAACFQEDSAAAVSVVCSALREEGVCVVQLRGSQCAWVASLCVSLSLAGFLRWFVSAAFRAGFNN